MFSQETLLHQEIILYVMHVRCVRVTLRLWAWSEIRGTYHLLVDYDCEGSSLRFKLQYQVLSNRYSSKPINKYLLPQKVSFTDTVINSLSVDCTWNRRSTGCPHSSLMPPLPY